MIVDSSSINVSNPNGFIVLEGVNGAGKTTLQKALERHCRSKGREVVTTREPGGTPFGKQIRSLLLEEQEYKLTHKSELYLFAADRAHHVETLIRPALESNCIVLCDRYFYSTLAFQGYGRGIDLKLISDLNEQAVSHLFPDLVILLDLDPEDGLERNRGDAEQDSFEQEQIDFHKRIRDGFLKIAKTRKEPFFIIDAKLPAEAVAEEAIKALDLLYFS